MMNIDERMVRNYLDVKALMYRYIHRTVNWDICSHSICSNNVKVYKKSGEAITLILPIAKSDLVSILTTFFEKSVEGDIYDV